MRAVVAAIVIVGLGAVFVEAGREQTATSTWKAQTKNQWPNRWEGGDLPTPAAARPLELVSFLAAPTQPAFKLGDELTLSFYLDQARPIVRPYAREIRVRKHYWMEPMPPKPQGWVRGWNPWGPWPTGQVLPKLGVAVENVGVLVRLDDRHPMDGRVAAVLLNAPATTSVDRYDAVLLAGTAFARGEFEVRPGCGSGPGGRITTASIGQQRTGSGFSVLVDLTNRSAGDYELVVSMIRVAPPVRQGAPAPAPATTDVRRYCFYHQPDPRAR